MKYTEWVKKNWITMIGIIIILSITWYDVATVQSQKQDAVNDCNAHWKKEVEKVCPAITQGYNFDTKGGLFIVNNTSE